jgi:hypothetical protein
MILSRKSGKNQMNSNAFHAHEVNAFIVDFARDFAEIVICKMHFAATAANRALVLATSFVSAKGEFLSIIGITMLKNRTLGTATTFVALR